MDKSMRQKRLQAYLDASIKRLEIAEQELDEDVVEAKKPALGPEQLMHQDKTYRTKTRRQNKSNKTVVKADWRFDSEKFTPPTSWKFYNLCRGFSAGRPNFRGKTKPQIEAKNSVAVQEHGTMRIATPADEEEPQFFFRLRTNE